MNDRRRSTASPFPALLGSVLLLLFLASCSDSTSPNDTSNRNAKVVQIQGTVRVSSDHTIVRSAVVRIMIDAGNGPGAGAMDTTSDGHYAVTAEVPGGCAGSDSAIAQVSVQALGYAPHVYGPFPKVACTTRTQTLDVLVDPPPALARTPQPVAGDLVATAVGAGSAFACATTPSGAYCWGVGGEGSALGVDANAGDLEQPTPVTNGAGLTGVSAGFRTACGLDHNGSAWCWGNNTWGALGVSDTLSFAGHALAVQTDLRFTQVAAGYYAGCGLTAGGAVYCWGCGPTLGAGDSLNSASRHPAPARVASDRTFVQVSEGYEHTCALDNAGHAWCWGRNSLGQLGNPQAPAGYYVTTPQQVAGGHRFVAIAVGGDHACGLTAAGVAWCWGSNGSGQLGDGRGAGQGEANTATPVAVAGGHAFVALFGGSAHTCGLTGGGTAWCWGNDNSGQLGLGDQASDGCGTFYCAREPMPIAGSLRFSTLGAGAQLSCGITAAGKLYCWGLKKALGTG